MIANFEVVVGGSGDDQIVAGSTSVSMTGGAGNDALEGGAGNDTISDGTGCDTVSAGGGDDHVVAAADAANDSYDGGAGQDSLDYSTATFSITVDVGCGTANGADIGQDLIAAFEEVIAGSGDDHLVAGSTSVSMTGGDGNDTFEFQRAEDDHAAMTVRKITDFTVGDRIVAATYEITYLQEDGAEDAAHRHVRRHSICPKTATIARCAFDLRTSRAHSRRSSMCMTGPIPMTSSRSKLSDIHQLQFTIAGT